MPETLDISFDSTTSADNPAFFQPADPSGATGLNHVVDTTNVSVTFFQKDGTMLMRDTLQNFFAGFAPETFLFDARVIYDHYWDRFVLVAMEHTEVGLGDPSDRSEMLIAVSDDGDPAGTWHMAQVFTLLSSFDPDGPGPLPPGPHWADFPIIGMERQQLYLTFRMNSFGATPTFGGTTIWNIFKWDVVDPSPSGGFYGGQNATIHAGIRPFSLNNDFANEVPLAPAYFHGTIVANPVDRGMFFVGYSGASLSGDSTIQVFWVTTVGPSASKLIVQLGTIDNIGMCSAFPDAPQMGSAILLETNCREVLDAVWRDDTLTFVTQIEPLGGSDAGEATAHWVQFSAPDPSTITLSGQGDISGDVVAPNAHTFFIRQFALTAAATWAYRTLFQRLEST